MTRRTDIARARASLERAGYTVTPGVYIPARPVAPRSPATKPLARGRSRSGMAALIYLVIVAGIIGGIVFGIQINAAMPMTPPDQLVPVAPASTQSPETPAPVRESAVPGDLPRHNVIIIPPDFSIPWGTFLT